MAAPVLAALLPGFISGIVDAFRPALKAWFPDPEQQAKAELQLKQLAQKASLTEFQGVVDIITAEAKSEHWLTSTWRPITALTFVAIVANNYILYP